MKYKVLWIDDEYEKLSVLMEICEKKHGFEIVKTRFAKEGMTLFENYLYEWSAVVLDAKVLEKNQNEVPNLKNMMYSKSKIEELRFKRYVPTFIFTGENGNFDESTFESLVGRFYVKGTHDKQLVADIITEANKLIETQIIMKYPEIYHWFPNKKEFIEILRYVEENKSDNAGVYNLIRKQMEWLKDYCYESGLTNNYNLNLKGLSIYLGDRLMKENSIVPTHVQCALYAVINTTNTASHILDTDYMVKCNKAPYAVYAIVYEFLNILYWAKDIPQTELGRKLLREKMEPIHKAISENKRN